MKKAAGFLLCLLLSGSLIRDSTQYRHYEDNSRDSVTPLTSTPILTKSVTSSSLGLTEKFGRIHLVINATTATISVLNLTADVSVTLNRNADLIGTINTCSGVLVVVNLTNNVVTYVAPGQSNISVEALATISLARILEEAPNRTTFLQNQVPVNVLRQVSLVLVQVSLELRTEAAMSTSDALSDLLRVSASLSDILKESQHGYFCLSSATVPIRYDAARLAGVVRAVRAIVNSIFQDGADTLKTHNVAIDMSAVLGSTSTVDLLLLVIREVATHVDVDKVLNAEINSDFYLWRLIIRLSVIAGPSDVTDVVAAVLVILRGATEITLVEFSLVLIGYLAINSTEDPQELLHLSNVTLRLRSEHLSTLSDFLRNVTLNSIVVGSVNVSDCKRILLGHDGKTSVDTMIQFLLELRKGVPLEETLGYLIVMMIEIINRGDVYILKLLVPEVNANVSSKQIIDGIGESKTLPEKLSKMEVIGTIVSQLSSTLKLQSHDTLDLFRVLQSSTTVEILQAIKLVTESQSRVHSPLQMSQCP